MSRCSLTSPASHKRVLTIMASAIHTMPPCFLTRISSAWTWPRSRGCSTRCSCTAWPWRPARAPHAATVRSSNPKATTIACSGQPWASSVTISATGRPPRSAGGKTTVPVCCREGLATLRADEALVLARMEANIALTGLASGGTRHIGAECRCGVHASPPSERWGTYQEEYGWTPVSHCKRHLTTVSCGATEYASI